MIAHDRMIILTGSRDAGTWTVVADIKRFSVPIARGQYGTEPAALRSKFAYGTVEENSCCCSRFAVRLFFAPTAGGEAEAHYACFWRCRPFAPLPMGPERRCAPKHGAPTRPLGPRTPPVRGRRVRLSRLRPHPQCV